MANYFYKRYHTDVDGTKETLDKYGVAIIPNVLNEEQCENMVLDTWSFFEDITSNWEIPLNRYEKSTWKNIYELYPSHSMLIQHWGIGHSKAAWDVRQNINVINVFAKLWNVNSEDLLVSFDGMSFGLPPEVTNRGWHRKTWYHSDQSFTRNDFECVQGWVTGIDVENDDATLGFLEGSHKLHEQCAKKFQISDKNDWFKLTDDMTDFYIQNGCKERCIKCPRGSLVLWDSRTIHCGVEAHKGRDIQKLRCVAYVCYMPRSMATECQIKKKIKAYEEQRMTTHWPCKNKLFPTHPRTYGGLLPNVNKIALPELTDLGKKLCGY